MAADEYTDDPSIPDEAILWRRVPPWHVHFDNNIGSHRPSSPAFDDHPDGSPMSVVIAAEVLADGRGPEDVLKGHSEFSLAAFTAGLAREKGQLIARRPVEGEPAHAEVVGKKTDSVRRTFAKKSTWVVPPASSEHASAPTDTE